jgi:hypothetical protein
MKCKSQISVLGFLWFKTWQDFVFCTLSQGSIRAIHTHIEHACQKKKQKTKYTSVLHTLCSLPMFMFRRMSFNISTQSDTFFCLLFFIFTSFSSSSIYNKKNQISRARRSFVSTDFELRKSCMLHCYCYRLGITATEFFALSLHCANV